MRERGVERWGGEVRGEGERSRGMGGKLGVRERGVEGWEGS